MKCCFGGETSNRRASSPPPHSSPSPPPPPPPPVFNPPLIVPSSSSDVASSSTSNTQLRIFSYKELLQAAGNFHPNEKLGRGGFGTVYKGTLLDKREVAIKQLSLKDQQGSGGFRAEILTLGKADHPNLVKLIGYCDENNLKLLVYELMPLGSLDYHLFDLKPNDRGLDWITRMKIAAGAARGLAYLHNVMNPPIIHRDVKSSNILLGENYHPKLSDFGLAREGPEEGKSHVSTRVMGTHGYCAPEYKNTGQLTFRSDIFSFGVVLLEIITGKKAIFNSRDAGEQELAEWARPLLLNSGNYAHMADPTLRGQYPSSGLSYAFTTAALCVNLDSYKRPVIAEVVGALEFFASQKYDPKKQRSRSQHRRRPSYP